MAVRVSSVGGKRLAVLGGGGARGDRRGEGLRWPGVSAEFRGTSRGCCGVPSDGLTFNARHSG